MRTGRSIIISAILALGAAGSILAGSAVPAIGVQASSSHVVIAGTATPQTYHYG